jgi:hypothetical protein
MKKISVNIILCFFLTSISFTAFCQNWENISPEGCKNSENKTVSNSNIGYGLHTIKYADGKTKDFIKLASMNNC